MTQQNQSPEDTLDTPDELSTLKSRADFLGIGYHPSIGVDKLREKVMAALSTETPATSEAVSQGESEADFNSRKRNEALELVRIHVTCMNPNKKDWDGEIFTAGNTLIGTVSKFVPFNNEEGWHVPRIIYNQVKQRDCQIFYAAKDAKGNDIRKGKLIKEFAINILPNLTSEELHDLAQRQAMAKSID